LTLLLLMKPRFLPVPGHTPVSSWTSSVPVLNRALKNIQCWIISSLTWTPLLPRFPIAFFLPVCFCLDSFGFWIYPFVGFIGLLWTALDCASSPGLRRDTTYFSLELSLGPTFFVAPRPIGHTLYVHRNTHHYSN